MFFCCFFKSSLPSDWVFFECNVGNNGSSHTYTHTQLSGSISKCKTHSHSHTHTRLLPPTIPWELMLPGVFVLEYKSHCHFERACQRRKTSTQSDSHVWKHTATAPVNVKRSSLQWLTQKCVCMSVCSLCTSECVLMCPPARTSDTHPMVVFPSVNMSSAWSIISGKEKLKALPHWLYIVWICRLRSLPCVPRYVLGCLVRRPVCLQVSVLA